MCGHKLRAILLIYSYLFFLTFCRTLIFFFMFLCEIKLLGSSKLLNCSIFNNLFWVYTVPNIELENPGLWECGLDGEESWRSHSKDLQLHLPLCLGPKLAHSHPDRGNHTGNERFNSRVASNDCFLCVLYYL